MTSRWLGHPLYHEATVDNNPVLIDYISPEVVHLVRLILNDPTVELKKIDAPVTASASSVTTA